MHCENSAKQTAKESTATFAILLMSGRVPSGLTCAEPSVSRPPRRGLDAGAQRIGAGRQPCAHVDRGKVGWLRTDTGTPGCVVLLRAERSRQEMGKFRNMRGPVTRLRGPGTRGSGTRAGSPGNPKTAIGHQGGHRIVHSGFIAWPPVARLRGARLSHPGLVVRAAIRLAGTVTALSQAVREVAGEIGRFWFVGGPG